MPQVIPPRPVHTVTFQRFRLQRSRVQQQQPSCEYPTFGSMARTRMAVLPLLLATVAFCATSFLAPRGTASSLRGPVVDGSSQQPVEAAMQARGGEQIVEDPSTYILGISALMIVSVVARTKVASSAPGTERGRRCG